MRGKNIVWLSLIAVLLMPLMISVSSAPSTAKLSIIPSRLPEGGGTEGYPGDVFEMAVMVENVHDMWSAGFTVKYAPYGRPLAVGALGPENEGPFLKEGGYGTAFAFKIFKFAGELKISVTRLNTPPLPIEGASGDGILATFVFNVVEAGESDIELVDVLLADSNLEPIPCNTFGSEYYGPTANLIRVHMPGGGRVAKVGEQVSFGTRAINHGSVPVIVRACFDMERLEDGRRIKIYSGQNYAGGGLGEPLPYEEHYLTTFVGGMEDGTWTHTTPVVGDSLLGPPDGEYAECTSAYGWTGYYAFDPIALLGREIYQVDFRGYTQQPDGNTDWDFDPYIDFFDSEGNWLGFAWCDSFGGAASWAWTGGRYYEGTDYDMPEYYMNAFGIPWTEEVYNNMLLYIENYCPSGPRQQIDSVKMKVEFAAVTPVQVPEYELGPYSSGEEELELDPMTIAEATEDMIGTYVVTCTLEYTIAGAGWMTGDKIRTFTFEIKP